jgi:hypothetical protein
VLFYLYHNHFCEKYGQYFFLLSSDVVKGNFVAEKIFYHGIQGSKWFYIHLDIKVYEMKFADFFLRYELMKCIKILQ